MKVSRSVVVGLLASGFALVASEAQGEESTAPIKLARLHDTSKVLMPEACSPETRKSSEISRDGVFAEHGA